MMGSHIQGSYVTDVMHTARTSLIPLSNGETCLVSGHILGSNVTDVPHTARISYH